MRGSIAAAEGPPTLVVGGAAAATALSLPSAGSRMEGTAAAALPRSPSGRIWEDPTGAAARHGHPVPRRRPPASSAGSGRSHASAAASPPPARSGGRRAGGPGRHVAREPPLPPAGGR